MSKVCVICKRQKFPGDTRIYHGFPQNGNLRKRWMEATGITNVRNSNAVCSDHFDESAYENEYGYVNAKKLGPNAVPVVYTLEDVLNNEGKISEEALEEESRADNLDDTPQILNESCTKYVVNNFTVTIREPACISNNSLNESTSTDSEDLQNISNLKEEILTSSDEKIDEEKMNPHSDLEYHPNTWPGISTKSLAHEHFVLKNNILIPKPHIHRLDQQEEFEDVPLSKSVRINIDGRLLSFVRSEVTSNTAWQKLVTVIQSFKKYKQITTRRESRKDKKIEYYKKLQKILLQQNRVKNKS